MFTEQQFSINELKGTSAKTIEEHKKLYAGYVKNTNMLLDLINKGSWEGDGGTYAKNELQRRFAFEWGGMKNHEVYFKLLEGVSTKLATDSPLKKAIEEQWGSFDEWQKRFNEIAMTRGVGWAILCYDRDSHKLINAWIDEQHLGQLANTMIIVALDMWEHSYVADYQPSGKKQYIADFMDNLNWSVAEAFFSSARSNS